MDIVGEASLEDGTRIFATQNKMKKGDTRAITLLRSNKDGKLTVLQELKPDPKSIVDQSLKALEKKLIDLV